MFSKIIIMAEQIAITVKEIDGIAVASRVMNVPSSSIIIPYTGSDATLHATVKTFEPKLYSCTEAVSALLAAANAPLA